MKKDEYIEVKKRMAEELFRSGANCSQAVTAAFAQECGLTEEEAFRLSSGFGGGFGRMREVCGAVSGMTLVCNILCGPADVHDKAAKDRHYALIRKMADAFRQEFSSVICRELLHLAPHEDDIPVSTERTEIFYQKRPCIKSVSFAAGLLAEEFYNDDGEKQIC